MMDLTHIQHSAVTNAVEHSVGPGAAAGAQVIGKEVPLALAGASAAVGAVVVVFVLFGLEAYGRESLDELRSSGDHFPRGRLRAVVGLVLHTSCVAMAALLLLPLFLIYNLAAEVIDPRTALAIGIGAFAYAIVTLIVALVLLLTAAPAVRRYQYERVPTLDDPAPDGDEI